MLASSLQSALCCWSAQQQSPPSSPTLPCSSGHSAATCTGSSIEYPNSEKAVMTTDTANSTAQDTNATKHCSYHQPSGVIPADQSFHEKDAHSEDSSPQSVHPRASSPARHHPRRLSNHSIASTASRSSYLRGFLSSKKSHPELSSSSSSNEHQQIQSSSGKSSSKNFSLQSLYYPRNTMTAAAAAAPSSPSASTHALPRTSTSSLSNVRSTSGSFSRMSSGTAIGPLAPLAFEGPRALGLVPPSTPPSIMAPSPPASLIPPPPQLALTAPPAVPSTSMPPQSSPMYTDNSSEALPLPPTSSPLLAPTLSLTLPTKPVSIPTKSTPMLTTSLSLPLSPTSPPSLSVSPSSPSPSTLSLQPLSLSALSHSYSSASSSSSFSAASSPNTSPSTSPTETSSCHLISSPLQSDLTPYPACAISPARLAALIERGELSKQGVSAGPRPLVLDLRPNPDFDPISIVHSININLPTLLMRRYRRGGAVASFALESFITMPSDKDMFHLIQDGWRQDLDQDGNEVPHDVVVLDQDMQPGKEEYGRSPSPAWTLVSVLERGGGNCGGPIRLWFLEGGFEAFEAWELGEKFLMRPGSTFELSVTQEGSSKESQKQDVEMTLAENQDGKIHPLSLPLSLPSNSTSSTITDAKTAQAIDHAVSLTNASLGGAPRQRGAPTRRESLFSLNTKSLQRPAGLSRAQTIGVSALNIKPLSIPPLNTGLQPLQEGAASTNGSGLSHPLPPLRHKGSWLTVPTGASTPSPAMSLKNNSMEIAHSASPDHASTWSANSGGSINGDAASGQQGPMSDSRKSISSSTTLFSLNQSGTSHGIQEEDEESGAPAHPFHQTSRGPSLRRYHSEATYGPLSPTASHFDMGASGNSSNNNSASGFHQEYQSRMFADGIDSYTNSIHSNNLRNMATMRGYQGYDDEMGEEGGDDGEQQISCILPNFLYLGPEIAREEQVQELERLGIKRVLNMARECEDALVVNHPGMEYHKIGVHDHIEADVSAGLLQAVDCIAASNDAAIYVHCKAGKSRSVTAIIAYLITQLHWSLNKAYNHVLTQRPCMCPNIGFVTELMRMEERTLGTERAGGLARAGSLNSILSLSTAGSGAHNPHHPHHHHHHHSLQHHHSLSMGGSPKMLSAKSSMNSLAIMSPPFQQRLSNDGPQGPF